MLIRSPLSASISIEPLMSQVIKKFGVEINILAGISALFDTMKVGHLFVEFGADESKNQQAIAYLKGKQLLLSDLQMIDSLEFRGKNE